jgi:thiol-disulfide isomerase/thioredoxin
MPGIYELASRYISPYYLPFVVVFLLIVFIVAGYYIYTNYVGMKDSRNKAIYQPTDEKTGANIITVYFFTADWCPHCRNAKPAIDEFQTEYDNKIINKKTISIKRVDCTDSEIAEVAEQIAHFNVTSFPTVKIQDSNGKIFEFDAKITNANLENFVKTVATK